MTDRSPRRIAAAWTVVILTLATAGCRVAPRDESATGEPPIRATPGTMGPTRVDVQDDLPSDTRNPAQQNSQDNDVPSADPRPDSREPSATDAPQEGVVLDLSQVDVSEVRPWEFHGRLDLAYTYFRDSTNVDRFRNGQVLPISPGLYFQYRLLDWLFVVAEVEYDGREEEIEVDQALLRIDAIDELLTLRLGRHYFPFGLERYYYSPSRNTLVDRPAAFRQVYPGTYADNGLFVEGKYTHHTAWSLGYEAAVTQGLRGFEREDLPETLEDNNDTPFVGGRVYFQPRRELTLGVSYLTGYWDRGDDHLLDFFGLDAQLEVLDFDVRLEYVGGQVQKTEEFDSVFRQGWYLHVERTFELEKKYLYALVPVFRIDWIDSNDEVKNYLDVTRYSFGFTTFFLQNLQWKLEYSLSDERGRDISNNGFLTQVVFHW